MSENELIKLYEYSKREIVRGGDWRFRVVNSVKYKLLDAKYDGVERILDKAEEYMKGTNVIEYYIRQEVKKMIKIRERMNYNVKSPFFDDIDREILRIKTVLTYYNIPEYRYDLEYLDEMIGKILTEEAVENGLKFRD